MDTMSIDPAQGRRAVSAAADGVAAVRDGRGGQSPPVTAASFGTGLGEKGARIADLIAGAHGVREGHLRRLQDALSETTRLVDRIDGTDRGSADRVGRTDDRGGDR